MVLAETQDRIDHLSHQIGVTAGGDFANKRLDALVCFSFFHTMYPRPELRELRPFPNPTHQPTRIYDRRHPRPRHKGTSR